MAGKVLGLCVSEARSRAYEQGQYMMSIRVSLSYSLADESLPSGPNGLVMRDSFAFVGLYKAAAAP